MKARSGQQALDELKRIASMFPGLFAVFQDIAEITTIEAMADAAEKRKAAAEQGVVKAQQDLAAVHDQAAAKLANAEAAVLERMQRADSDAAEHRATGERAEQASMARAEEIVNNAKKEAERVVLSAQNAAAAIENRSATAKTALDQLEANLAQTQARLDEATGKLQVIEQHKANLAAALQATG